MNPPIPTGARLPGTRHKAQGTRHKAQGRRRNEVEIHIGTARPERDVRGNRLGDSSEEVRRKIGNNE